MGPVATINGIDIHSDKHMSGICNSRVTFTDGSWCDVITGEVVNKGTGFISIGKVAQKSSEEKSTFTKSYSASSVAVRDVEADVEVQPHFGSEMVITIEGKKSGVEGIQPVLQGNCLVLSGKSIGRRGSGANVVISGGGNISISGNGVNIVTGRSVVMGGAHEADVKVRVQVPVGSGVQVAGVQGNVKVGDTDGSFVGNLLGDTDMTVGKVRDAQLSLQGGGDIRVAEVNGNLTMSIQGSGEINVSHGIVSILNVNVMGSGDANFGGTATDANLSVVGSGDIDVRYVRNRPNLSQMGSGDIKVRNH